MIIEARFEVADRDESGKYTWQEAVDHLAAKGDGWRLPTRGELDSMYQQRESIGGFASAWYWSSSEGNTYEAWGQYFGSGYQSYSSYKAYKGRVRAVRDV
jgi:hypothetical protein